MKSDRDIVYPIPLVSVTFLVIVSAWLFAIARVSKVPIITHPLFYLPLAFSLGFVIYELFSWVEFSPTGVMRRSFFFFKSSYSWSQLYKFCYIPGKGSKILLLFNDANDSISIPLSSIHLNRIRHHINAHASASNLLYNGHGREWLARRSA